MNKSTKKRRLLSIITAMLLMLLSLPTADAQNAATMQILVFAGANKIAPGTPPSGQPAPGVSIYVLTGANKISTGMPPTGATDGTGAFVLPPGILSAVKPHTKMKVYEVCVDGKKVIFILPEGSESQLPKDTDDCKKRYIGGFYWDGGSTVVIDIGPGGTVKQIGGGGSSTVPSQVTSLVSVSIGGSLGFKQFAGEAGDRSAFSSAFSGGNLNTPSVSFAQALNGSVGVWHFVVDSELWRANSNNLKGTGSVPGGSDTSAINQQFQGALVTAGPRVSFGNVSIALVGGGNFWRANIDTTETVTTGNTSGTTSGTVRNSDTVHGKGYTVGASVKLDVTPRWSLVVRYNYLPMSGGPVNIALHEGSVGFLFRISGGAPGK